MGCLRTVLIGGVLSVVLGVLAIGLVGVLTTMWRSAAPPSPPL